METQTTVPIMPFGRWKNHGIDVIDSAYLTWLLANVRLSSVLRHAVASELCRRGIAPAPPPLEVAEPVCRHCPGAATAYTWAEDAAGRKVIRAECSACHRLIRLAPQVEPFVGYANDAALDQMEQQGDDDEEPPAPSKGDWVRLTFKPDDAEPVPFAVRTRRLLKHAKRACGMKCTHIEGRIDGVGPALDDGTKPGKSV